MESLIKKRVNSQIDERYIKLIHRSGLTVYIVPKDMSTTNVILAAKCGSLDNAVRYRDENGKIKTATFPDGIAHFVEHKLFANPDGVDTAEKLAFAGANCNAYTTFDKTAYMFSAKDNIYESLKILLESYFTPYFTHKNVLKERSIIQEEIKMYNDDPGDSLFFSMLSAMFSHPYMSTSGCGTISSIKQITPDLLKLYHSLFYHPQNTVLCICGNADPVEIEFILDKTVPNLPPFTIEKIKFPERQGVISSSVLSHKNIPCPILNVGIKLDINNACPEERMKELVGINILCEHFFSSSNPFISDLYENGEVSSEIKYGLDIAVDRGVIALYTETRNYKSVSAKLKRYIEDIPKNPLTEKRLEILKKVLYSQFLSSFDTTADVANELVCFDCDSFDILNYPDIISSIDLDFVNTLAKKIFLNYNICIATACERGNNLKRR